MVNALRGTVRDWWVDLAQAWDRFWFTPAEPHTLAAIRILAGSMLFYTHLVWALDLSSFLGPHAWMPNQLARTLQEGSFSWSYLWYIESPVLLWMLHIAALVVMAMLTLGIFSRITSVVAWLVTVAYCHRLQGALFGLDQVNAMLTMYLMVGCCGGAYSLDRVVQRRRSGGDPDPPSASVRTNVAIRLIQLHMCVIYLFGGIGKMRGEMWWDGSALWYSFANLEYQSLDMTWLISWPVLISLLTHVTVFWETFYCVLVWPRLTRPIILLLAVCVHGGIAVSLGMITFGVAMLFGNLSFVSPHAVRAVVDRIASLTGGAEQGDRSSAGPTAPGRRPRRAPA